LSQYKPKRVLLINIFGIGDVLFTTPILKNLKAAHPNLKIGYICNRRTAPLLERSDKVDFVYVYERDEFVEIYKKSPWAYWKAIWVFIQKIKKDRYDVVIDVSLNSFTSFLAWWIGIKIRIGYNYRNRSRFLTHSKILQGYENKHVVEYYLDLLSDLGVESRHQDMEIHLNDEDQRFCQDFLRRAKVQHKTPLIGLVPGGGASWGKDAKFKRWQASNYAKLADKIIENFSSTIILMGDKSEQALCEEVSTEMKNRPISACGQTSIFEYAALAKRCTALIVNDGGPLHVAVAAGARTVSIFGPVDDRIYGPFPLGDHKVVTKEIACRPCYQRFRKAHCEHIECLNGLSVDDVFEVVQSIM